MQKLLSNLICKTDMKMYDSENIVEYVQSCIRLQLQVISDGKNCRVLPKTSNLWTLCQSYSTLRLFSLRTILLHIQNLVDISSSWQSWKSVKCEEWTISCHHVNMNNTDHWSRSKLSDWVGTVHKSWIQNKSQNLINLLQSLLKLFWLFH